MVPELKMKRIASMAVDVVRMPENGIASLYNVRRIEPQPYRTVGVAVAGSVSVNEKLLGVLL